ncbi:unnamed protein product [Calypogeia fissa]
MPGRSASSVKMPPNKRRKKQGGSAVPPLPPTVADEDIEVSDEDVEFVRKHKDYVGFISQLDTKSMTRQVLGLKPDDDVDDLETKYETSAMRQNDSADEFSVDPVDVLPVKALDGKLHYRSTSSGVPVDGSSLSLEERRAIVRNGKKSPLLAGMAEAKETPADELEEKEEKKTKAERRKEAKQLKSKLRQETQQDEVPVEEESIPSTTEPDLERVPKLRARMAEIAVDLLADPNGNILTLKEIQDMCIDRDEGVSQYAMLSSMAIFKDLIPGYRIRLPTEKEREMMVSKEVRSLWDYETALLRFYQAYVQLLVKSAKTRSLRWTALRCLCGLLDAVPHFNYRESILSAVVPRMASDDENFSIMCCQAIKGLFVNPGKHGDEATVEAVQLIADFVRLRNCHLPPEVIQVFLSLSFDDDLLRESTSGGLGQSSVEGPKKPQPKLSKREEKKGKKAKKQLAAQLRKEVEADFKESSVLPSVEARKKFQMLTLSSLFETYFRILKTSLEPERAPKLNGNVEPLRKHPLGPRPLLRSCLEGLARFSHLISVDFMADLLRVLQVLAKGGKEADDSEGTVSVWERLQCCTVAFKIVRINMDALNIDLREFYTLFYKLLIDAVISDGEHSRETLAQALQIMLWDGTHNDMSRVAAFVKRLATLALHLRSGEAVAALATAQQLLVRYKKSRIILENNPGSGPVSSHAMVLSGEEDPDLSDALSSVLWELTLLGQHYNPEVVKYATTIATMNKSTSMVMPSMTPVAAVKEFSSFLPSVSIPAKSQHRKQSRSRKQPVSPFLMALEERSSRSMGDSLSTEVISSTRKLFGSHFKVLKACRQRPNLRKSVL